MFSARHVSSAARAWAASTRRVSPRERLDQAKVTIDARASAGIAKIAKEEKPPPPRASQLKTIRRRQLVSRERARRRNLGTAAPLSQHVVQSIEVVHDAPMPTGFL